MIRQPKVPGPTAVLALAALGALALLTACATTAPPPSGPNDPDQAVASLHNAWLTAPSCNLYEGAPTCSGKPTRSRAFLRRQAQNLAFRHPTHVPTRMLLAAMAYEANDPTNATRHLDYLLRLQPEHPEAAILRSRIAIEGGNESFSIRLLTSQIRLRPDHAGLREALASAHFMAEDYAPALAALDASEALGGSPDRIAYNRGLIAEEQGSVGDARRYYQLAGEHAPGWPRPLERLAGLAGAPVVSAMADTADYPPPPPLLLQPPMPAAALR